jgi:GT2 family glycosyltransferase
VVVDNNSTDGTRDVVSRYAVGAKVDVKYLFEPTQGISYARNRGIAATDSDYIAFTDDDVIVDPGWLLGLMETFVRQRSDCVGGRILPYWLAQRPGWLSSNLMNVLALLDYGEETIDLNDDQRTVFGANLAFRRQSLVRAGMFNVDLGRKGHVGVGEDQDMLDRMRLANGKIAYAPHAVVFHKVGPERLSKRYFRRWHYAAGRDRAKLTRPCRFTVLGIEGHLVGRFMRAATGLGAALLRGQWDRVFEHELQCILYLSIFRHKLLRAR